MLKHRSPQELMAAHKPLNRVAVAPVDIYNQPPVSVQEAPKAEPKPKTKSNSQNNVKLAEKPAPKINQASAEEETDSPYSTYLFRRQVKGIKLRAIEQGVKDKHVVQQAVDEYFKNHPL